MVTYLSDRTINFDAVRTVKAGLQVVLASCQIPLARDLDQAE